MGTLIVAVINLAIFILVLGLCFLLIRWALGLAGIPLPPRLLEIVCAIIVLIFLLSMVGGFVPMRPVWVWGHP